MTRLFFRAQEIEGCVVHDPMNDVIIIEKYGDIKRPNGHPIICAVNFICEEARKKGKRNLRSSYSLQNLAFRRSS